MNAWSKLWLGIWIGIICFEVVNHPKPSSAVRISNLITTSNDIDIYWWCRIGESNPATMEIISVKWSSSQIYLQIHFSQTLVLHFICNMSIDSIDQVLSEALSRWLEVGMPRRFGSFWVNETHEDLIRTSRFFTNQYNQSLIYIPTLLVYL